MNKAERLPRGGAQAVAGLQRVSALVLAFLCLLICLTFSSCKEKTDNHREEAENTPVQQEGESQGDAAMENILYIKIGERVLTATLEENSSAKALREILPVTIEMRDYSNFEKVGPLGHTLPRNDERITTSAGDLILYQGDQFVIYYGKNTWSLTRLGKIRDVGATELLEILGEGNVTVTLLASNPSEV